MGSTPLRVEEKRTRRVIVLTHEGHEFQTHTMLALRGLLRNYP